MSSTPRNCISRRRLVVAFGGGERIGERRCSAARAPAASDQRQQRRRPAPRRRRPSPGDRRIRIRRVSSLPRRWNRRAQDFFDWARYSRTAFFRLARVERRSQAALRPMIGMARQNREAAIELFGGHHARELMRPGHRAKRQDAIGFLAQRRIEPVGSADRHRVGRRAAVAGLGRFPPPIARWTAPRRAHRARPGGRPWAAAAQDRPRLLGLSVLGASRAALVDFAQSGPEKPDARARSASRLK